jgi:hypothetical protein
MSLFNIELALQQALESVPFLVDIAWPNVKYEPTLNNPFVRPTLLPSKSEAYTLNDGNKHHGIYQVDIYVPNNKGIKTMYSIADDIKDYFTDNKRLTSDDTTVFITAVGIGKSERQDAWYTTYVEIQYLSYN